jgi:hypothetical protein
MARPSVTDIASIVRGGQYDYKKLFYSNPEQALTKEVTLQAGYGLIPAGTVLAKNVSAAGNANKYVPLMPGIAANLPDSGDPNHQLACAFLVQDVSSGSDVYVTMDDSYKFAVGDDLILLDESTYAASSENLGAITAIDRTTYLHMAKITVTATVSGSFTVAGNACVHVEAGTTDGTTTNSYSVAEGILMHTVDTGTGEDAQGAVAPMVISNAMLYNGLLTNCIAQARTDLGASVDGQFLIIT